MTAATANSTPAQPASRAGRRRSLAWAGVAAFAALLLLSVTLMSFRVAEHYRTRPPTKFAFQVLDIRDFSFGHPRRLPVSLQDDRIDSDNWHVNVSYGDEASGIEKLRLRVTVPGHPALIPVGLAVHNDWLRVLRFADASGKSIDRVVGDMESGATHDRLAIVTRTPRAGVDPSTWGRVWVGDWTFNFYEFLPAGGFEHQTFKFPTSRRSEAYKPGEIVEGTWQYDAAMLVMPEGARPKQKFMNSGVKAMGWTFPVAGFSTMAMLACLTIAVDPKRARFAPR